MTMQAIWHEGTRAVVLSANQQTGPWTARLYVNCKRAPCPNCLGDATLQVKRAKRLSTVQGYARKWLSA